MRGHERPALLRTNTALRAAAGGTWYVRTRREYVQALRRALESAPGQRAAAVSFHPFTAAARDITYLRSLRRRDDDAARRRPAGAGAAPPGRRIGPGGGGLMPWPQCMRLAALLATATLAGARTLANKPNFILFFVDVRV